MCDKQCSQYGDCCRDLGIPTSNSSFTCVTTAGGNSLYMKTSCPPSWQRSSAIKSYCERENIDESNTHFFIPVTSERNFTYQNLFCALCHEDPIFEFWMVGVWETGNSSTNVGLSIGDNKTMDGVIPAHLVDRVRHCQPGVIDKCSPFSNSSRSCPQHTSYVYSGNRTYKNVECFLCNEPNSTSDLCSPELSLNAASSTLDSAILALAPELCDEIPELSSAFLIFCGGSNTDPCSSPPQCLIDAQIEKNDSSKVLLINNDTIFLKSLNMEIKNSIADQAEWIPINDTFIYVCGKNITIPTGLLDVISSWLSDILIKLSIICLVLHLVVFYLLPKLRNTPARSLAAYCCSLLVAFLCLDLDKRWGLCRVTAFILHYTLLCCFTWMLLMSYNCWLSTYRATTKLRQTSDHKSNRFAWYFVIAFFVPMVIVGIGAFLEHASHDVVPCAWRPKYGSGGYCFIGSKECFLALFIIPSSTLFVLNDLFFAHTAYLIYFNQSRSTVKKQERINFKLYFRLALIMGSTWIFGSLYTLTEWDIMQILFILLNLSQGIFIFIAFTLQKRNLKMLRSKYKKNSRMAAMFTWLLGEEIVSKESTESSKLRTSHQSSA